MKLVIKICLTFFLSTAQLALADFYNVLSLQTTKGQNDLYRSTSLIVNYGLGYQTLFGVYFDWTLGLNSESIAEIALEDKFLDQNQQSIQMDFVAGYKLKIGRRYFIKIGAGFDAAYFSENCTYSYLENRDVCDSKKEQGPTYKAGYYFRPDRKLLLGIEFNRDELSNIRKYNGISLVVNVGY